MHQVFVEEVHKTFFLFRLTVGIHHPRCLVQDKVLQFLIFLEGTHQRCFIPFFFLPQLKHRLHLRILVDDELTDAVGIVGSHLRDSIIIMRLTDSRQGLNHQPCGVVGIFYGQFLVRHRLFVCTREERRQVDGLRTRLYLGEGPRHCHTLGSG